MARTPSPQPTDKQLALLEYLIGYVEEHGYQPTQAEMSEHFGLTRNAAGGLLQGLAERGLIEMPDGRERAIVLKYVKFQAVLDAPQKGSDAQTVLPGGGRPRVRRGVPDGPRGGG